MIENCIADVRSWFTANRLKINDANTDFLYIGIRQQLEKTKIPQLYQLNQGHKVALILT